MTFYNFAHSTDIDFVFSNEEMRLRRNYAL